MSAAAIIAECREALKLAEAAESNNRARALAALEFGAGKQWPTEIEAQRALQNRPCLTINKTDALVRQVVNNMRQQRPRMVCHPVADGADQERAEIIQGYLRHIEVNSSADVAYDTAGEFAVRMGWGYIRVATRYLREDSFDQDIYIDAVMNPFSVYFDPASELPDGSDAEWCVVSELMSKKEFKRKYPRRVPTSWPTESSGDDMHGWANDTEVRIAEYWKVERVPDTLVIMSNGWSGFKSKLDPAAIETLQLTVVKERESYRRRVRCWKLTAFDVLEEYEWAGRYIPIVPVYGVAMNLNGKVDRYGMIKNLMDPARMYNFWRTSEAELVALAPKAPWVMAEGQDEGYETEWRTANQVPYSVLKYKPQTFKDGTAVPPPQRQPPAQIPEANVNAAIGAGEDLKAVAGIFDPSTGQREHDPSGIALQRHQQASENSNYHFYDNLTRSMCHIGRICVDLMPHIVDTQRVLRIIGEDGEASTVTVNEKQFDELGAIAKVLNDVTVGTYDVVMDTGPGYNTKRLEAADSMLKLLGTPLGEKIAQLADDIVIRHFDWPGARELADRLAAANPLAQAEAIKDLPPEAQGIVKQLQGQVQQLQQALQQQAMQFKARADVVQLQEGAETQREQMRLAVKQRDIDAITATKRHDTETKALSAQNVEEIKGIVQLLLKHLDGAHLEREIAAQDAQLEAKSNETEPA